MNEPTGNEADTELAPIETVLDWSKWASRGRVPFVIVRHGQTAWNKERRCLGRMDIPLDGEGRAQAAAAAGWLKGLPQAAIYASPLSRAWQTTQAIGMASGLEAEAIDGLMELHQGELEGRPSADLPTHFPELFAAWTHDPTDVRVPGGETLGECQARAIATFTEICRRHQPGPPPLVVSHKMFITSFICHVKGWPLSRYREIEQNNTALNLLSFGEDGFQVHRLNETAHLRTSG